MNLIRTLTPPAGSSGPVVLTGVYYLILDECVDGFLKNGCTVHYPAVRRAHDDPQVFFSEPDMEKKIGSGEFDLFFTVNGDGLDSGGRWLRKLMDRGKTIAVWYVDDPMVPFAPWYVESRFGAARGYDRIHFFAIDQTFVDALNRAGFGHAHYLPHAASFEWAAEEHTLAAQPDRLVTFVNHLDLQNLTLYEELLGNFPESAHRAVSEWLAARRADMTLSWPDFAHQRTMSEMDETHARELAALACRIANIRLKLEIIPALEKIGVNVYGYEDWNRVLANPSMHKGHVPYYHGLATVYRRSTLVVNLTHPQLAQGCNQRVFDVPATGGYLITDHRPALAELFPSAAPATFRTLAELVARIHDLVENPSLRDRHRAERINNIRARHTHAHRMRTVLDSLHLKR